MAPTVRRRPAAVGASAAIPPRALAFGDVLRDAGIAVRIGGFLRQKKPGEISSPQHLGTAYIVSLIPEFHRRKASRRLRLSVFSALLVWRRRCYLEKAHIARQRKRRIDWDKHFLERADDANLDEGMASEGEHGGEHGDDTRSPKSEDTLDSSFSGSQAPTSTTVSLHWPSPTSLPCP